METINQRYILQGLLGEGGMGIVYRALDRLSGRQVALKRVYSATQSRRQARLLDADTQLELAREFQALAALRHPNIISVLDYGFTQDHVPYFTMELIQGGRSILKAGSGLELGDKADLLVQLLRALMYIHRHGIVHRDLKPSNVLVERHPQTGAPSVKVLDFGLSVPPGEVRDALGTLPYMAPEVLLSSVNDQAPYLTVGVDLHAVGVLAYQLFVGYHPFCIENIDTLVQDILYSQPDFTGVNLPPALMRIIERLLEKHPYDRYSDAGEVISDLRAALGQPLQAEDSATRESLLQAARFVGRSAELQTLSDALQQASTGTGGLWLIRGESGLGKSRLVDELQTRALIRGVTVLRGHGIENGGLPYQLWREPLRQLLLATPVDDLEAATIKPLVPDIHTLLNRPIPDAPIVSSESARQRLIETIVRLFQRQQRPTLLVLEDLHWAVESLLPLTALQASLPNTSLLVVASYRPEERPTLAQEFPDAPLIVLDRLNSEQIAVLSVSMIGSVGRRDDVLDLLEHETEGNIYFLIEVMRALAEHAGGLSRIGEVTLPAQVFVGGVETIVSHRLGRAPDWGTALLKRAAVAGRWLDLRMLDLLNTQADLLGGHTLLAWLSACADAAILEYRDESWRFAHDKLRERLIRDLGDELPSLHREIALALEDIYADVPSYLAYAETLLDHWQRAGDPAKEVAYILLTATQAVRFTGKYSVAQSRLWRALDLIALNKVPDSDRAELRALQLFGDLLSRQAQPAAAANYYETSVELAEALADTAALSASLIGLAEVSLSQTLLMPAVTYAEAGLRLSQEIDAGAQSARCLQLLAQVHLYRGELVDASHKFKASLKLYHDLDLQPEVVGILNALGILADQQAQVGDARTLWEQGLALAEHLGDRVRMGLLLHNLGQLDADQGRFRSAQLRVAEAVRIFREMGQWRNLGLALATHAALHLRQGDLRQAEALIQDSLTVRGAINDRDGLAVTNCSLAANYTLLGDYPQAEGLLSQSLAFFQRAGNRRWVGRTLRDLGLVAYLREEFELAVDRLRESVEHFEVLNDRRGMIYARAALAMVHANRLEYVRAQRYLAQAIELTLAVGLPLPSMSVLVAAAILAIHFNQPETAARWKGLLLAQPALTHENRLLLVRLRPILKQRLGAARFEQQLANGAELNLNAELAALAENYLYLPVP